MVPFAGYEMPVQYPAGILKEHLHTRARRACSTSRIWARRSWSGRSRDQAAALETLVPGDIAGLKPGQQRYSLLLNDDGGIIDDLMVTRSRLGDDDGRCSWSSTARARTATSRTSPSSCRPA